MLEPSMLYIPSCWNFPSCTSLHAGTFQAEHPFMLEHSILNIPTCWNIPSWTSLRAGIFQAEHPFILKVKHSKLDIPSCWNIPSCWKIQWWAFLHAGTSHSCSHRVIQLYAVYPDHSLRLFRRFSPLGSYAKKWLNKRKDWLENGKFCRFLGFTQVEPFLTCLDFFPAEVRILVPGSLA